MHSAAKRDPHKLHAGGEIILDSPLKHSESGEIDLEASMHSAAKRDPHKLRADREIILESPLKHSESGENRSRSIAAQRGEARSP